MERVASLSPDALLERVAPAIASGSVNVISVEAIRGRSQARWPRTRDKVEAFVERSFARLASPRDLIVALNDLEYLTIQPEASRAAALNLSGNVLKETLKFFLGSAEPCDLKLMLVTGFADGELAVEAVDFSRLDDPPAAARPTASPDSAPTSEIDWQGRGEGLALVAGDSRDYRLALSLEPVWNVGARAVASFRIRASVAVEEPEGRRPLKDGRLPAAVAGAVALHALDHAVRTLGATDPSRKIGLHVPVPIEALSYSNSRYRLLHALRDVAPEVRRMLLLEVTNLPAGFPPGRMTELVSTLAPYCRAVLARAADETAKVAAWRGCGLAGVTLDCGHLTAADRNAHTRLRAFAAAASKAAPGCVGYMLGSRSLLMSAWAAGFTHLGGGAVEAEVRMPAAQRFHPERLYREALEGRAA
ncbi:hypothetical protein [Phenylobacterium sp.]|jgi:hypothetical protein|uniref:hypothetical protein n=1 Tax=Phenylobacterium sp. TaxID=1871053 RepID=UPI003784E495